MAAWCISTGFGPDVYRSLTVGEINEFYLAAREANSASRKG